MTPIELKILAVAKNLGVKLVEFGIKNVLKNENDAYIQELYEVIVKTNAEAERRNPIAETDRIPFYKSKTLLEIFLKFRFSKEFDKAEVKKKLEDDPRIIPPTTDDLKNFFEIFDEQIGKSEKLAKLHVEVNYKEEIFNISDALRAFRNDVLESINQIKTEIVNSNVSSQLVEEWNLQLDEIVEDLKKFKAKSASRRLDNLLQRIQDQGLTSVKLLARIYKLQADSHDLSHGMDVKEEQAKLLIKVYQLLPTNPDHKSNAALAYFALGEYARAVTLADELLVNDEYNIAAWCVKCFSAGDDVLNFLATVPKTVRHNNLFVLNLYRWGLHKNLIRTDEDIQRLDLKLELDLSATPTITYRNLHYQHLVATFLLNVFYGVHKEMTPALYYPEATGDVGFEYGYRILELSAQKLKGTEIEEAYRYYEFQYHCSRYILYVKREDLVEMDRIYRSMQDYQKQADVHIRMMQAYVSLDTNEDLERAIEAGLQAPKMDVMWLLIAGIYMLLGDEEKKTESFLSYLKEQKKVSENVYFNFIHFIRHNGISKKDKYVNAISDFIKLTEYEEDAYRLILELFSSLVLGIGGQTDAEIAQKIDEAKSIIDPKDERLSIHIAFALVMTERMDEAKSYLESFLNTEKFSEAYLLYCKVLYKTEGGKVKLMELLRKHREGTVFNKELLKMEVELVQLQGNFREAAKIAKRGIELFPASEYFLSRLFYCLNASVQLGEIKQYASRVAEFDFKDEQLIISVSQVLIRAELFQDALNLLYRYAVVQHNTQVRQAYFGVSYQYPEGLLKDFEEVRTGTFVKYEVNRQSNFLEINKDNENKYPFNLFLGKKVGETFSLSRTFSTEMEMVKVVRIMDKYLALFEEIIGKSNDPLTSPSFKSFELKGSSPEEINASFQEAFGVQGTLEKDRVKGEYDKYYNGKISFGEITNSVFKRNLVDAYFLLTHNDGKPFMGLSHAFGPAALPEAVNFVLDVTSLCLFYMLDKECDFVFTTPFVVSPFLRQHLVEELEQTKRQEYGLSVSVTVNSVVPHFYDDEFKTRRINTFQTLIDWLDAHCIIADIPERLDFITAVNPEYQADTYFNIYLDNRLLLDKPGNMLLTHDLFYLTQFGARQASAVSPVCFLKKFFSDKQKEYTTYMLSKNYVGIPINAMILQDEFLKMLAGQSNKFSICLENLKHDWNPEVHHIENTVVFIKNLYVSSFITIESRSQWVKTVLQNLITGMDPRRIRILRLFLGREFRLLGLHASEVEEILTEVVSNRRG